MSYLIAGVLAPLFWLLVLSVSLWLVRRYVPGAESWLFAPLCVTVRRSWRALTRALRRAA
jgi:hypothetical protein